MDERDLELRDSISQIRASRHYAYEGFKDYLGQSVRLGKQLAKAQKQCLLENVAWIDFLRQAEEIESHAGILIRLAERFFDYDTFTDDEWTSLHDNFVSALADWSEYYTKNLKPRKAWRLKQVLRRNPMAEFALLCLHTQGRQQ